MNECAFAVIVADVEFLPLEGIRPGNYMAAFWTTTAASLATFHAIRFSDQVQPAQRLP